MTNRMTVEAPHSGPRAGRREQLRRLLDDRRREIVESLRGSIREIQAARAGAMAGAGAGGEGEAAIAVQDEIDLALLQMKGETLVQIDDALVRLGADLYGQCRWCGADIAVSRLRVLPFARRCPDCDALHKAGIGRAPLVQRRGPSAWTM